MHPYKRVFQNKENKNNLSVISIITLLLFSILLNFIMLRKNRELSTYNKILRESRALLIENLKESNQKLLLAESVVLKASKKIDSNDILKASKLKECKVSISRDDAISKIFYKKECSLPYHISNGPIDKKIVSFTFDGGSLANLADPILDTLSSRGVKSTIFLTGEFIKKYPETVKRILSEGHECGNHTYTHPHLTTYSLNRKNKTLPDINEVYLAKELFQTAELFYNETGHKMVPLWRAPYGEINQEIAQWAYNLGYIHIGWRQGKVWLEGLDSNDWITDPEMPGYRTPQEFLDKILSITKKEPYGINGGIILMHLGSNRKKAEDNIYHVLGTLIDSLRSYGYDIVPVSKQISPISLTFKEKPFALSQSEAEYNIP